MSIKNKNSFLTVLIVFIFILSAVVATPAYADEATPPVDVPAETQPDETASQESAQEETPQPEPTVDSVSDESGLTDSTESIFESLPEDTQLIVIDENGETLPLVTLEAQEILDDDIIDPVWCPVGVAPQDGINGCTVWKASLKELFDALMDGTAGVVPNTNGVIWIEAGADGSTGAITLNGNDVDLGNMENFSLTLQGGWNGTFGSKTITGISTFSDPISITNWKGAITINNITVDSATGIGILLTTEGNIVLSNVQTNNNTNTGANFDNTAGAGNVTITNSTFNNNLFGLSVFSKGTISVNNVTSNDNTNSGVFLDNVAATTPKTVTVTGTNTFNANGVTGLYINSIGAITLNNISASNNSSFGAEINNDNGSSIAGVTLNGTNIFNDNNAGGLVVESFGLIKINNLFVNSNNGTAGASLTNSSSSTASGITLTGSNEFKYNNGYGFLVSTKGVITLNNISANSNNGLHGVSLNNVAGNGTGITITGTNTFNDNFYTGLNIQSTGLVSLNNITANGNGTSNTSGYGVAVSNNALTLFKGVTLTGTNSFNDNFNEGITIYSSGPITLNNVSASNNNDGSGASLNNQPSGNTKPMAIIINGTNNNFSNNGLHGLIFTTYGAVTLTNITASNNGQDMVNGLGYGIYLSNTGATTPQAVKINGTNVFNDNYDYGLFINSQGAITTNNITAISNNDYGVFLQNSAGTANITMTGTNKINENTLDNLYINSNGSILLNNITANSASGIGATVSNNGASSAKPITLTGTNTFNLNGSNGLIITSNGLITLNNISAIGNTSAGAIIDNTDTTFKAGVTINGTNTFSSNSGGGTGLYIATYGNVKINSVKAESNQGYGVQIIMTADPNTGSVTFTGTNTFYGNTTNNLSINTYGAVTLSNISSTNAIGNGAVINNSSGGPTAPKPVTLTGTNVFSNNTGIGLYIESYGTVITNSLMAVSNGGFGVYISNAGATTPANVTLNGNNTFTSNTSDNLYINNDGLVKINNINSTDSVNGYGAYIDNNPGKGVTLTGTNSFSANRNTNLYIDTQGAITVSNITSTASVVGYGADLDNATGSTFATPKAVTLTGTNTFSDNDLTGLEIRTYGSVTINNLTANDNGIAMNPTHGEGADIVNYFGDNTIVANVTLTGNNTFNGNYTQGLSIISFGAVKLNNVTASENDVYGAFIDNSNAPSNIYGVTLTGNNTFFDNGNDGLQIRTKGAVSLNNMTVTKNGSNGLFVNNTFAGIATPKPVTITGVNNFSDNVAGFYIDSHGAVTISKVTASNNTSGAGGSIINNLPNTPTNVTITGYGIFNNNNLGNGLYIVSKGAVTLTNITTIGNTFSGLDVNNNSGTGNVTLTGINTFNNNGDNGATINSNGNVSITKITGDENGQSGLYVVTAGTVTLTCGSFNMNNWYGWEVDNATLLTLKGVFTAGNTLGDYDTLLVPPQLVFFRACPLP